MTAVLRRILKKNASYLLVSLVFCLTAAFSNIALAGTIVRVSTTIGDYSIELLDDITPATVQNFLNYVNRNDYNGTYLHRVVDNFVVQGGAFRFQPFVGPIDVATDPPVVNEFMVSNTRGTVAMAKIDGDPNSATNQWFVNIANNSANLDSNNGGFTVFGNVLGDGLTILDAIDDLPVVALGFKAPNAPYIVETYTSPTEFVYMNVEVVQRFSSANHIYESVSGLLITSVNVDSGAELISMNFNTVASLTDVIIEANLVSVIPRKESFDGIATYSTTDTRLRIPSLEVNLNGSVSVINNVVFVLSDVALSRFTLESYDE